MWHQANLARRLTVKFESDNLITSLYMYILKYKVGNTIFAKPFGSSDNYRQFVLTSLHIVSGDLDIRPRLTICNSFQDSHNSYLWDKFGNSNSNGSLHIVLTKLIGIF